MGMGTRGVTGKVADVAVNRGAPTPPIALPNEPAAGHRRLMVTAPRVEVNDALMQRLEKVCPTTSEIHDLDEHGRDWWPRSVGWVVESDGIASRPAVVARPSSTDEVAAVARLCHEERVPLTPMGGRSGVCGNSLPVHGGVALDLTSMHGIEAVDDESLTVDVLAGTFGDVFEDTLRADYKLTCGHWPQSMALSTVGGWLACRSAGQFSTRYGKIEDMVRGLEVVLADGRVIRTGYRAPREAVGPDLSQLFVGSEGTLAIITRARLAVHPEPTSELRAAYAFASFAAGLDACRQILRNGATPAVLRLYDERESARSYATGKPGSAEARSVLLVLDEGHPGIVAATMDVVNVCARQVGSQPIPVELVEQWMHHRNDVSALVATVRSGVVVDTCEVAAPWSKLAGLYNAVTNAVRAVPGTISVSSHQSHAYADGACLYFTLAGRCDDPDTWYRAAWDAATRTTIEHGGTPSHHHGIGLHRGPYLRAALGPAFEILESLKATLDPHGILNPAKLGLRSAFGPVTYP